MPKFDRWVWRFRLTGTPFKGNYALLVRYYQQGRAGTR